MKAKVIPAISIPCAIAALALHATAAVTSLDYYRLGEDDPDALLDAAANAVTFDSSGNAGGAGMLNRNGNPFYSSDVSTSANTKLSSTFSMVFDGTGDYYQTATASVLGTNNIGVEGWFKPMAAGDQVMAYTGNTSNSGFGLIINGGNFQVLLGGIAIIDSGVAAALSQWTYFAFVRNGGVNSIYIDSASAIAAGSSAPNVSSASTSIGANQVGGDLYTGLADEVRFFEFAPGTFVASTDLLISVPEPSFSVLGAFGALFLLRRKRDH